MNPEQLAEAKKHVEEADMMSGVDPCVGRALVAEVERLRGIEAERDALRIEYARLDRIEDEAARIAVGHLSDMQLTGGAKRCFDAPMHALHVQTELPEEARIAALRAAGSGE